MSIQVRKPLDFDECCGRGFLRLQLLSADHDGGWGAVAFSLFFL